MATAILVESILRKAPTPYEGFDTMPMNGKWRPGRSGQTADDVNPYTNDVLVTHPAGDEQDVDEAYRAAADAAPLVRDPSRGTVGRPQACGRGSWRPGARRSSIGSSASPAAPGSRRISSGNSPTR